jgi:hypothetical protein
MMRYAILNTSGQWWTGETWGVKEAREEYDCLDDVPRTIDDLILCGCYDENENFDLRYYEDEEDDAVASVRIIR